MLSRRIVAAIAALGLTVGISRQLAAAPASSATITPISTGATNSYSLTLTNGAASTSSIQTFWFSWKPGQDYLATDPLSVSSPAGWTDTVTTNGPGTGDGYAIEWIASTGSVLAAGDSLGGFGFTSVDTPAELAGDSVFYPTTPVLTTFTYSGVGDSTDGEKFLVTLTPVPEPMALAVLAPAAILMLRRVRKSS